MDMLKQGEKKKTAADPMVHLLEAQLPNDRSLLVQIYLLDITCCAGVWYFLATCFASKRLM